MIVLLHYQNGFKVNHMTDKNMHLTQGYHTVTPYLIIKNAAKAIEFYQQIFGAQELMRMAMPDGKIGYAEIQIGDSLISLSDEFSAEAVGPASLGGSPVRIHLYVNDVDALVNKAIMAGAKLMRPIEDHFFGDRAGSIEDPFGHIWNIATRKEDITRDEMLRRFNVLMNQS